MLQGVDSWLEMFVISREHGEGSAPCRPGAILARGNTDENVLIT